MLMIARILWRLIKSGTRVLLIGWAPPPPPNFEARLIAVEHVAENCRKKLYRDGKAEEAAAENLPVAPQVLQQAMPELYGVPRHSDGTPVQHGDSLH